MDARVMQDIDGYSSSCVNGAETFFDNSADFTQQFASTNFWDTLDDSSNSSFVNSAAASVSLHTPSTTANSPASHTSAELPTKPRYHAHKHSLTEKSGPKKRRCSEESKAAARFVYDPSPLDCSDYWLRFDSDNESLDQYLEYPSQDTKPVGPLRSAFERGGEKGTDASFSLNLAESFADAQVRSLSQSRPLPKTSTVATAGDTTKVALPPVTSELIDDSALDQALSDDDDLFSMALVHELGKATTSAPTAPPDAQERLYSTPLSWEQPRPGYHMNYMSQNMPIGDAERQRLLAIALGTGQAPAAQTARPPAVADFHFEMTQSPTDSAANTPEPKPRVMARPAPPSRKNSSENGDKLKEKPKNSERAAHNDIERKYRTNLKDKIAELRDAIPSLRAIPEDDDPNSPAGSSRTAPKVSKGTVLTKATEYIHQLERRNRSVAQKNEELARRLQAFEQLVGAPAGSNWRPQSYGGPVYGQRF
ncbi:helix-loop-helix DNA-binding domain-containing protein [Astrocystis sublimbata]|nr:helix-loop-helix DNA-binding domain-containing protein [Astrocystis sublimbata]